MPEEIKKKGKKENKKEKPTYNVLQCLRFAFSRVWKYSKIYYLIVFMSLIFHYFTSWYNSISALHF